LLSSRRTRPVNTGLQCIFASLTIFVELEEEIEQLESNNGDKARLAELKSELEKINKKKEEYVKEHPEQRNLVYRRRRKADDRSTIDPAQPPPQNRNLFNKKGLPRHPERSIYYDPVLNPYGAPPPGMPYLERRKSFTFVSTYSKINLCLQHCGQTKWTVKWVRLTHYFPPSVFTFSYCRG
jgi:hypothetical protein